MEEGRTRSVCWLQSLSLLISAGNDTWGERGKPIELDRIEQSGTCYTGCPEKPDLWTGREDAPRSLHRDLR